MTTKDDSCTVDNAATTAAASRQATSANLRLTGLAAVLAAIALAGIYARTARPDTSFSTDGPYHVAMADRGGAVAIARTFPWTRLSIWHDCFYDKELGFHVLLAGVRRWGGLFGYRGESPPFLLEKAALLLILAAALYGALRWAGCQWPALWLLPVLLACPAFTHRISQVRPQVLSISVLLIAAAVLSQWPRRKRPVAMFLLGAALAYCHSNPHFIALPAGVYLLAAWRSERWRAAVPLALGLSGALAGLVLHPQFPNTLAIWKIQCVDVPWQALTHAVPGLSSPSELERAGVRDILWAFPVWLMLGTALAFSFRALRARRLPFATGYFLGLAALCGVGFLICYRTIEYMVPFAAVACALAYEDRHAERWPRFHQTVFALLAAASLALLPIQVKAFSTPMPALPRQFAAWCRAQVPPGTYIANLYWDDFARLFFVMPEYVFASGLDPMFSYAASPDRHLRLEPLINLQRPFPPPAELMQTLQAQLVFVPAHRAAAARRMAQAGYALPYQGVDGWCFDLAQPTVDHRLGSEQRRLDAAEP